MLLQTSIHFIYSSIVKITASNFQEMFLSDGTLKRQHELDFDEHSHKVPFVIAWPIYIVTRNKVSGVGPYLLHVLCSNF